MHKYWRLHALLNIEIFLILTLLLKENAKNSKCIWQDYKCYLVWHPPWHRSEIHNGHCLHTQTQGGNTFLIVSQRVDVVFHRCLSKVYRERKKKNRAELSQYVMPVKVKTDKTVSFTNFSLLRWQKQLDVKGENW